MAAQRKLVMLAWRGNPFSTTAWIATLISLARDDGLKPITNHQLQITSDQRLATKYCHAIWRYYGGFYSYKIYYFQWDNNILGINVAKLTNCVADATVRGKPPG